MLLRHTLHFIYDTKNIKLCQVKVICYSSVKIFSSNSFLLKSVEGKKLKAINLIWGQKLKSIRTIKSDCISHELSYKTCVCLYTFKIEGYNG